MYRLLVVCSVLMLGGFAVGRWLRPRVVEAAPEQAAGVGAAAARAADADTALFLRPGDAARMTRTRGPLTLALEELPGVADLDAPLGGRWRLRFTQPGAPETTHVLAGYAVTGALLVQLDTDPLYEAVVLTYTGGAHCCTTFHTYDEAGGVWRQDSVEAGSFTFDPRDVDGDGPAELVSEDPRFEYAFGSFAGSRGPSRIVALRDGRLHEATQEPRYHAALVAHRDALMAALPDVEGDPDAQRGLLAALAAQHALLGTPRDGFALVTQTYQEADRDTFFHDLRAFLMEHGFVTEAEGPFLSPE